MKKGSNLSPISRIELSQFEFDDDVAPIFSSSIWDERIIDMVKYIGIVI